MSTRSPITTHVLDTAHGKPAEDVRVVLQRLEGGEANVVGKGQTDSNGRIEDLLPPGGVEAGDYRLEFDTGGYFAQRGVAAFFPKVTIDFSVTASTEHYHVPLLLSPFGFSTYRGS
ncbi:MAG: hydroxyisourate hydrolase [Planctomycetota bacterium]